MRNARRWARCHQLGWYPHSLRLQTQQPRRLLPPYAAFLGRQWPAAPLQAPAQASAAQAQAQAHTQPRPSPCPLPQTLQQRRALPPTLAVALALALALAARARARSRAPCPGLCLCLGRCRWPRPRPQPRQAWLQDDRRWRSNPSGPSSAPCSLRRSLPSRPATSEPEPSGAAPWCRRGRRACGGNAWQHGPHVAPPVSSRPQSQHPQAGQAHRPGWR